MAELSSVANLLAVAPQEHEPPPELRRNLLSRIGGATGTPLAESPTPRARLRRLLDLSGLAAAAAVLAVVGLLVWNVSLREENEDLRGELQTPQIYELQGSGAAQNVRGEVVQVRDDRAILVAENLPPTPEGEVYRTWLMRDDVPEPAGTFEPRDDGTAAVPINGSIEDAEAVAVTMEQNDDSPTPKSDPLMTAEL